MAKYVVAYDLHKPHTVSANYDALNDYIEKSFGRAEKVLNTTYIVTEQGSGFSIMNQLQGYIAGRKWEADILVTEIKLNELYAFKDGVSKTYSSF